MIGYDILDKDPLQPLMDHVSAPNFLDTLSV